MADRTRETLGAFLPPESEAKPEPEWSPPEWPDECPAVGMYPDVRYEDYRAWPALNSSALKEAYHVSAYRMKAAMDGLLGGDSPARKFGRAIHCRLLEPEAFKTRFLLAGKCEAIIKSGAREGEKCNKNAGYYDGEKGKWYCGSHEKQIDGAVEPEDYVSLQEAANIERIVIAVKSHQVVKLLRLHGGCEVSFIYERDGIACKGRADKLILDAPNWPNTVIDIKKCQSGKADEHSLQTSIRLYGWDMQAFWYVDGIERLTGKRPEFNWIFVEDSEPFDVRVVSLEREMYEVGRCKVNGAFEIYKEALRTNQWPGYGNNFTRLRPAEWEIKRYGA